MKKRKILVSARIQVLNEKGEEILNYMRDKIKEERLRKGLSQRELSFKVNKSENFISKVENGDQEPHILDMIAISIELGKPLAYFIPQKYRDKKEERNGDKEEMKEQRRIAREALEKIASIED